MDSWIEAWLTEKYGEDRPGEIRIEELGQLAFGGELAVWHPLDDLYEAPRIGFGAAPDVQAVWLGEERAGYVLRAPGSIRVAAWRELGDASTDTDRFFLVPVAATEAVIDWLNEDPAAFEQLGGERSVTTVEHAGGTRIVVIESLDGNARVRAGFGDAGQIACAIIDT